MALNTQSKFRQTIVCGALFALMAPAIGALLMTPFLILSDAVEHGFSFDSVISGWMLTTIFAYVVGIVPAFLTGLVAGFFKPHAAGWLPYVCMGLVGLMSSAMFGRVVWAGSEGMWVLIIFGVPGCVAAAACTFICRKAVRVSLDHA